MASRAAFVAPLLAGEMPQEIEEAFAGSSVQPVPRRRRATSMTACSCPDWENPCKHIAAVFFLLAEAFDDDPFLIFAWRGRDKEELLAGLRKRRRGSASTEADGEAVPDVVDETEVPAVGPFGWPLTPGDPSRCTGTAQFGGPVGTTGRPGCRGDPTSAGRRARSASPPARPLRTR